MEREGGRWTGVGAARPLRLLAAVAVGAVAPVAVSWLLLHSEPVPVFPGTVLLGVVVALAAFLGLAAATTATVSGAVCLWAGFVARLHPGGPREADVVGVLLFLAVASGALVIVERMQRSHRREADQRRLVDTVIDEAPVGIALFDRDLRFRRANRRLAALDGRSPEDHLGRTPSDLSTSVGGVVEPLLRAALEGRTTLADRALSWRVGGPQAERHFRAGFFPVRRGGGEVVGVGATIQEVTAEVAARDRAEKLLVLAEDFAAAASADRVAAVVTDFLAVTFGARAQILVAGSPTAASRGVPAASGGDLMVAAVPEGDDGATAVRVNAERRPDGPLDRCVREGRTVEHRVTRGEDTGLAIPLRDVLSPERVLGAIDASWDGVHELGADERTLLQTAASLTSLALSRIRLAEAAATDRFRTALEAMLDNVAIGTAVRDEEGRIVDFVLEYLNHTSVDGAGRSAAELVGRRVLGLYPGWRTSGMFERFRRVVETGEPFIGERIEYHDILPDGREIRGHWNLRVTRLGDGYIAASRDVTDRVRMEREVAATREARARQRLTVELLQQAALPTELPEPDGWLIGAHYRPASGGLVVGGDWYDAVTLADGRVALVIADVAGHGPQAAASMVQVRNWLRAVLVSGPDDAAGALPGEVLRQVNEIMRRYGVPFVTCTVAVLSPRTGDLTWSSAGHLPPLLVSGTARFAGRVHGPPLGVVAGAAYGSDRLVLDPGDLLVLYTDGLVERRDEPIDESLERLRVAGYRMAGCTAGGCPGVDDAGVAVDRLCDLLLGDGAAQDDDVAVVGLARRRQPVRASLLGGPVSSGPGVRSGP